MKPPSDSLNQWWENVTPQQAFALSQRFDMHYTPKNASWLNMVEVELSAISKQCLFRRIGEIATLEWKVIA